VGEPEPAHTEVTDVRRAAGGDHEAFERLYRTHAGRIYALAVRMVDDDAAPDLTQEIFIRAWQKLDTFRGTARFGTWLHRLAINHILSRRQTLRTYQARNVAGEGMLAHVAEQGRRTPGVALDMQAALRRLPARARRVFVLYDVEGYSHDEIAEMMSVTVGTSKSQLHRARMLMRDYLEHA
jgi:RNA polymerase sigma-70 factor (ECF subfamily)